MNTQKKVVDIHQFEKGIRRRLIWGIILIAWNMLLFVISLGPTEGVSLASSMVFSSFFLIFVFWGGWLCYLAFRRKQYLHLYYEYCNLLRGNRFAYEVNYEGLSRTLQKDVATVRKEVIYFTKHGLWNSIHGGSSAVMKKESTEQKFNAQEAQKWVSITCDSCQATTTINLNSSSILCEYCGSPLVEELKRLK